MTFAKADPRINRDGRRPKAEDKPTNRSEREKALLELTRRFKPHLSKAIAAAIKVIDNDVAKDGDKIKASALVISTYHALIKDLYNKDYDLEEAEEVQPVNDMPVFSLRMVTPDNEQK